MCGYMFAWTIWRLPYLSSNQKLLQMHEYTHILMRLNTSSDRREELLCNPRVLGGPQKEGDEIRIAPLPSPGPKRGRKCYVTLALSGYTNKRGQNQNWQPHPCLLGGPKKGRKCYVTPTFSGVPKQRGTKLELAASPLPSRGAKRGRKCYVTRALSGIPKQ